MVEASRKRAPQRPLAVFLMDQTKLAGVGNYLLSELLYDAGIWPWATLADLDAELWRRVFESTRSCIWGSYRQQTAERAGDPNADALYRWKVYRQLTSPEGHAVRQEEGPHGRTVHWVEEIQIWGRGDGGLEPRPQVPLEQTENSAFAAGWSPSSTMKNLKVACKARGLRVSGRKAELIARLETHDAREHN